MVNNRVFTIIDIQVTALVIMVALNSLPLGFILIYA
jgi:hypothetical protein